MSVAPTIASEHMLTAMREGKRSALDVWSEREPLVAMRQPGPDNAPLLYGSRRGITRTTPDYPDDATRATEGSNGGNR